MTARKLDGVVIVRELDANDAAVISRKLDAVRNALPQAEDWERSRLLVSALNLCGSRPLPHWLYAALCETLIKSEPKPSIHLIRWNLLLALRDVSDMSWKEALAAAAKALADTPAAGTEAAIFASYKAEERKRPPERRRPRTYRRSSLGKKSTPKFPI